MRTIIAAAALAVMLAGPAGAEPGPIGQWLMSQPVTLWDRGMDRADAAAERAGNAIMGGEGSKVWGGASYDWNNNEIDLRLDILWHPGAASHELCNGFRRAFLARLLDYHPDVHTVPDPASLRRHVNKEIADWFSHYGYEKQNRDKKLGEKLARIVFVTVALGGRLGSRQRIDCRARMFESEAASKPSG